MLIRMNLLKLSLVPLPRTNKCGSKEPQIRCNCMVPKFVKDDQFNCDHHDPERTSLVPPGHLMFGCEDCDWDSCPACFRRDNPFQYRTYINMLVRFKHPGLRKQRDAVYRYIPLQTNKPKRASAASASSPPVGTASAAPLFERTSTAVDAPLSPNQSPPPTSSGPPPPVSPPPGSTILPPPPLDEEEDWDAMPEGTDNWDEEPPSSPPVVIPPPEHRDEAEDVFIALPNDREFPRSSVRSADNDDVPPQTDIGSPASGTPWSPPPSLVVPSSAADPGSPAPGQPWSPPPGPVDALAGPGSPAMGMPWSPPPGAYMPPPTPGHTRHHKTPHAQPLASHTAVVSGALAAQSLSPPGSPAGRPSAGAITQERRILAEAYVAQRTWRHVGVPNKRGSSAGGDRGDWADDDLDAEIEGMISGHEEETSAAMKIQASFRGFQGRRKTQTDQAEAVALIAAKKEANEYRRLYEESLCMIQELSAIKAAAATTGGDDDDSDGDGDDSDDDDEVFADEARGSQKATYFKLLDAVALYDDTLPESAESNQVLVEMSQALTQEAIDAPPPRVQPALVAAAEQQKLGAALVLMYSGASATVKDHEGRTLLHVVLSHGAEANVELASVLVAQGLALDDMSSEGKTVIQHLVQEGVVPDLETALHDSGSVGVSLHQQLQDFVESEANSSTSTTHASLEYADSVGSEDDSDSADDDDMYGDELLGSSRAAYSKLLAAVARYDDTLPESAEVNQELVEIARTFTQEGIDSPPTKRAEAAIVAAARQQKWGAVMALMYCGASVYTKDREGRTLLHVVLNGGRDTHAQLAAMLSGLGLALDDVSAEGITVIEQLSAEHSVPALIECLAEGGPDTAALVALLRESAIDPEDDDLSDDIERMIMEHDEETTAAIRIQKSFRGFNSRRASGASAAQSDQSLPPLSDFNEFANATLSSLVPTPPVAKTVVTSTSAEPPMEATEQGAWGARVSPKRRSTRSRPAVVEAAPLNEFQQRLEDIKMRKLTAAVLRIQAWARGWKARRAVRELRAQQVAPQSTYTENDAAVPSPSPAHRNHDVRTVAAPNGHSAPIGVTRPEPDDTGVVQRKRKSVGALAQPRTGPRAIAGDPLIGTYVRALAPFTAAIEGQLTYAKGEVFFVLEVLTKGWYIVEKVDKDNLSKHYGRGAVARNRIIPYRPNGVQFVARKAPPGVDLLAHNTSMAYGHILHERVENEFHRAIRGRTQSKSENEQQLAFCKHDVFSVIKKGHKHGWYQVKALDDDFRTTAEGWVPRRYLEEIELTPEQLDMYTQHNGTTG
jgi:hypothetical protein